MVDAGPQFRELRGGMAYFLEMLTTPFGEGGLNGTLQHWRHRARTAPATTNRPDIPRTILGIGDALDFAGCSDFYLQAVQAEGGESLNSVLDRWWAIAHSRNSTQNGT
ncbi:hypothetical protein ACIRQQ_14170 [Streptomyces fuscichromogenes]|uniref:hypothetical protein n=1 Tax=Streptomyces fuscichromogenes TaxID=1324013 RepID=UPI003811D72E